MALGSRLTRLLMGTMLLGSAVLAHSALPDYSIGVYYYPGWSPGIKGPKMPDPWRPIRAYPEREPALGWYHDGSQRIVDQQLKWMHQFGIRFVVFDWYWEGGRPAPETSVKAYLQSPFRSDVQYALLWANHARLQNASKQWDDMIDYWLKRHLRNPEYLRIDDQPVIFIFSGDFLRDNAAIAGTTVATQLESARTKARLAGLKGIYFVLCAPATDYWVKRFARDAGFSALSGYNYHIGISGTDESMTRMSHSFRELDDYYRMHWNWILGNSELPYFVPMTSGWDSRPWGGSHEDPQHDASASTPAEFETHLRAAKAVMDANPGKSRRIGVICCWNEFGEGSYVEPTRRDGFRYLERVRSVFGRAP